MGLAKRYYYELEERSSRGREGMWEDKLLCLQCIHNDGIKTLIKKEGNSEVCAYCNTKQIALEIGKIIDHIHECILREFSCFDEAAGEYGIWDGEDKEYINIDHDSSLSADEVLDELGLECMSEDIMHDIYKGLNDEWYRIDEVDWAKPISGGYPKWKRFKSIIKNECRFFFKDYADEYENYIGPNKPATVLEELSFYIDNFSLETSLDENTILYRSRVFSSNIDSENFNKENLGPPSNESLKTSSRMSPDGIPVFYLAFDKNTAIKEIHSNYQKILVVSRWRVKKRITFVDLTKIFNLKPIDFFYKDEGLMRKFYGMDFLKSFSNNISKPIEKDEHKHIEYIPSQLVSEFIKFSRKVDGIVYQSSLSPEGKNIVLFDKNYQDHLHFLDYEIIDTQRE